MPGKAWVPRSSLACFYHGVMPDNYGGRQVASQVRGGREAMLVLGAASLVLGVVVALWPATSVPLLEALLGGYLALSAGVQVVLAVGARFAWVLRGLLLISAALTVMLAVLCAQGGNSVPMLSMWLGMGLTFRGVSQATVSVWDEQLSDPGRHELCGVLTSVTGVVLLIAPLESVVALGWTAGAVLIVLGAAEFALAGVGRGETRMAWARRGAMQSTGWPGPVQ